MLLAPYSGTLFVPLESRQRQNSWWESMSTGSTLLLVEDDPDIRGVLAEMLADEGYTVIEAGDGLAAIDLLHQPSLPIVGETREDD